MPRWLRAERRRKLFCHPTVIRKGNRWITIPLLDPHVDLKVTILERSVAKDKNCLLMLEARNQPPIFECQYCKHAPTWWPLDQGIYWATESAIDVHMINM